MTRVTFVGHSTVLVEMAGVRVLTDPILRGRVAYLRRLVPVPPVPDIDFVLVSHAHMDHLDPPSLRRLTGSPRVVVPRGCARHVARTGLGEVTEMEVGERIPLGALELEATPAEHDGRRLPVGRKVDALGYLLHGPQRVYFAGDTDLFDEMDRVADGLDVALLPVAGWGTRLPPGHLDPERAARAASLLRPRYAVPIHWGTLAGPGAATADPGQPAREFARLADVEVRVLQPGESFELDP
jgi:L-ascorbate metabolism protein UlaG (beta-lactamase superfamily)